jgi:hypothetical protein
MITIVTRWETSQMPAKIEWQMWRQLRGAFRVNRLIFVPMLEEMRDFHADQYETMEEALASCLGARYFLEPKGEFGLSVLLPQRDASVLVLGNTDEDNLQFATSNDYTVKINTPQRTHLYGVSAAAIALAYWVGQ